MKHILITVILLLFASAACADEIAITFDDLPGSKDESAENQLVINKGILKALKKFNAPVELCDRRPEQTKKEVVDLISKFIGGRL